MRKLESAYSFHVDTVDASWRYEFGRREWAECGIPCYSDEWEKFYRYDQEIKRKDFPFSDDEIDCMKDYADYDYRALKRYIESTRD